MTDLLSSIKRLIELIERKDDPESTASGNSAQLDMLDRHQPTVSDISPKGYVKVHAMGPGGKWDELHDYPVKLMPKMPGVKIVDRRGE